MLRIRSHAVARRPHSHRAVQARAGFTLAEVMIVAVLMGLIGSMLTVVLVRQQRFHRAVAGLTDARARMRDIETIVPTDLRSISTVAGDLMAFGTNSVQFRAFVGASVLCAYVAGQPTKIELPPKTMVVPSGADADGVINPVGTVLTAWINPPAPGDVAFLYNDSTEAGNADDDWTMFAITDTVQSGAFGPNSCLSSNSTPIIQAGDNATTRYRLTLGAAPNQTKIKVGAPIRFAREVKYEGYQGSDGNWYVGYTRCTLSGTNAAGTCNTADREVLAGPIKAISTDTTVSGLFFVFYKRDGTIATATTDTIARVSVGIRTTSESLRSSTGSERITGGDSLRFVIGIRNRI